MPVSQLLIMPMMFLSGSLFPITEPARVARRAHPAQPADLRRPADAAPRARPPVAHGGRAGAAGAGADLVRLGGADRRPAAARSPSSPWAWSRWRPGSSARRNSGTGRSSTLRRGDAPWPAPSGRSSLNRRAARRPARVDGAARPPPAAGHRHLGRLRGGRRGGRRDRRRAARAGAGLRRQRRARGLPGHGVARHRGADRPARRVRPVGRALGRPGAAGQRPRRQPRRAADGRARCCGRRGATSPGSRAACPAATRTPAGPRRH